MRIRPTRGSERDTVLSSGMSSTSVAGAGGGHAKQLASQAAVECGLSKRLVGIVVVTGHPRKAVGIFGRMMLFDLHNRCSHSGL